MKDLDVLLELVFELPHEDRCTIVYGPLCDCARGLAIEMIEKEIEENE
jgi:hypothetical protein